MIRNHRVSWRGLPASHATLGVVNAGDGGNAGNFVFTDGLSNDPQLAPYLQDLTPAQLQVALNGGSPSIQDMIGTPLVLASCTTDYEPVICGPPTANPLSSLIPSLGLPNIPGWVWLTGGGLLLLTVLKK
jgi:hypothetical protein